MINIKLVERIIKKNLVKTLPERLFKLFEIFKIVLAQWGFLGDSEFAHDSRKLFQYMQGKRFIEKLTRQLYSYRNSEAEFDNYGNNTYFNHNESATSNYSYCNKHNEKFSYANYLNSYRLSLCDFIQYPSHDSMDIMVYTNNRDAVIISTSLTSL